MKLILHIGTEKTGTTSIQEFLKVNRNKLIDHGIYSPLSVMQKNTGNHRWAALFCNNTNSIESFAEIPQLANSPNPEEILRKRRERFLSECRDASAMCNKFILSSEHFQSTLRSEEEIKRFHNQLKQVFDEIKIVIYIRDPLKTAISLLSQSLKWGCSPKYLPKHTDRKFEFICDHASTLNTWSKCFPNAELLVRRFEKDLLIGGDVIVDFCTSVFPEFDISTCEPPSPHNESLSLTGMALLWKMNFQFPRFADGKPNAMRRDIKEFVINNTNDGSTFLPCKSEFQAYRDHFSRSMESVRSKYFPNEKKLFKPQQKFSPEKIDLEYVKIDCSVYEEVIAKLWKENKSLETSLRNMTSS